MDIPVEIQAIAAWLAFCAFVYVAAQGCKLIWRYIRWRSKRNHELRLAERVGGRWR